MHCCAVGLAALLQQKNSKDWYLLNPQVTGDKVNILSPKSFVHFGDWNNTKLCLMKKFGRPEYQMKQPIKMALQCSSGIWRLSLEYIWLLNTRLDIHHYAEHSNTNKLVVTEIMMREGIQQLQPKASLSQIPKTLILQSSSKTHGTKWSRCIILKICLKVKLLLRSLALEELYGYP